MNKNARIGAFLQTLSPGQKTSWPSCYEGYFTCFNRGEYYEAHDVLEHLWLKETGNNAQYYKGLIQLAGAFVHLRKQYLRPAHPTDGKRLRPACRLFALATKSLAPYPEFHMGLNVANVRHLCREQTDRIKKGSFQINPWSPDHLPCLHIE